MPDVNKILASMFGLILVFLLLSRADEFNSIISAMGGFITNQTRALQGVSYGGQYQIITRGGN